MRKIILTVAALLMSSAICAQDDYVDGSYWTVTGVDTFPGQFNAYLTDLNGAWRKSMEMLIADEKVLSYKLLNNVNPREGEPDLWLMVEWSSGAAYMDTPRDYWDANARKLFGSMDNGAQANKARGEMREIKSNILLRELRFN